MAASETNSPSQGLQLRAPKSQWQIAVIFSRKCSCRQPDRRFFLEKSQKESQLLATFHRKDKSQGSLGRGGGALLGPKKSLRIFSPAPKKIAIAAKSRHFPDPPILAFFDFLAFFLFSDFPCFFCAFFLSFPRILGIPRREKPLLFWGKTLAFSKKARIGGSGLVHSGLRREPFFWAINSQ